ncbi:PepSY domain-containing protein [Sulfitobacter sp. LCG007]
MLRSIATALAAVLALSGGAMAAGQVELSDQNTATIREKLTTEGYEVGKIKIEDGLYEAYAKKDGHKYEIFLDGDFAVVRTEQD